MPGRSRRHLCLGLSDGGRVLQAAQDAGAPVKIGVALKLLERRLVRRVSSGQDVVDKSYDSEDGNCPLDGAAQLFLKNQKRFEQAWAREKAIREEEAKSDNLPRVLLKTSKGDITIELYENEAPNTVANFVSLVDRGYYDGITFHRVLPGFMAQGGDPKGNGSGGPGYRIPCECYQPNHRLHFRGVLSMAKEGGGGSDGRGRDTGGSQFFLTFVPAAFLDGNYTVFGRVIDGIDVLAKIQRRNPDETEPPRATRSSQPKSSATPPRIQAAHDAGIEPRQRQSNGADVLHCYHLRENTSIIDGVLHPGRGGDVLWRFWRWEKWSSRPVSKTSKTLTTPTRAFFPPKESAASRSPTPWWTLAPRCFRSRGASSRS